VADHKADLLRSQADVEASKRIVAKVVKANEDQLVQITELSAAAKKTDGDTRALQAAFDKADVSARQLQANLTNISMETNTVRARSTTLENTQLALILETEKAKAERLSAQIEARRAQRLADDYAQRNEDLTNQNAQLRAAGGGRVPLGAVKPPPALLSGLR